MSVSQMTMMGDHGVLLMQVVLGTIVSLTVQVIVLNIQYNYNNDKPL